MSAALLFGHVLISLVGIAAGFVVARGFVNRTDSKTWTAVFLATTVATSLSGFLLPADRILPSHVFAVLSLIALPVGIFAHYVRPDGLGWHKTYVATALFAQYLNVFVLVVQLFQKVPELHALAPTQSEPAFAIAQFALLVSFVTLGYFSLRAQRPSLVAVR